MQTITIPMEEYQRLKNIADLFKDEVLIKRLSFLIDVMYEQKYGLYMNNYTGDLTEANLISEWNNEPSLRDNI